MAEQLEVSEGWFDNRTPVYRTVVELWVAPEFLLGIIQGKYEADPAIFPEDVQVRHAEWDEKSKSFKLLLESSKYYLTAEGAVPCAVSLRVRHKNND